MKWGLCALAAAVSFAAVASPSVAQKSKDTLRIAFREPLQPVDPVFYSGPESLEATRMLYDTIVRYDSQKREYLPGVAASWKRIDDFTTEFKLRPGLKWDDGTPLTVDDIEYTFDFTMDPKVNYRFKETRINWIGGFEKIDAQTFRVKTQEPLAFTLAKLSNWPAIFPKHVHGKLPLNAKNTFGSKPVGSGPFRLTSYDPSIGMTFEKSNTYNSGNAGKPAASIGRVFVRQNPDEQTQIASFFTDKLDMIYNLDRETAVQLEKNPKFEIEVRESVAFSFIMFDAVGRSGKTWFKDAKVRQAMLQSIDREDLLNLVHPKGRKLLNDVCHPFIDGCGSTVKPPAYNPQAAKPVLEAAGLVGTDLTIVSWGNSAKVSEAVAGQLRKVGINAVVQTLTFGAFVKARADGVSLIITYWDNSAGQPDADTTASYFFLPGSRNYNQDKDLEGLSNEARETFDAAKRNEIYRKLFDEATKRAYLMPLNPFPSIVAHTKEVRLLGSTLEPQGYEMNRIAWN